VTELSEPRRERGPVGRPDGRTAIEPTGDDGPAGEATADTSAARNADRDGGGAGGADFLRGRSGARTSSGSIGELGTGERRTGGGTERSRETGGRDGVRVGDGCGSERRGGAAAGEGARGEPSDPRGRCEAGGTVSVAEAEAAREGRSNDGKTGDGEPSVGSARPAMYRCSGVPYTSACSADSRSVASTAVDAGAGWSARAGAARGAAVGGAPELAVGGSAKGVAPDVLRRWLTAFRSIERPERRSEASLGLRGCEMSRIGWTEEERWWLYGGAGSGNSSRWNQGKSRT
jgi:hypothetical protein